MSTGSINFVIQFSINILCFAFPEPVDISVVSKCDPCLSNPCKNNGTCNNDPVEFYQCTCPFGFKVWLQMNFVKSNKVFPLPSVFLILVPWEVNFTGNWAQKIPDSSRLCVTIQLHPATNFTRCNRKGVSFSLCRDYTDQPEQLALVDPALSRVVGLDDLQRSLPTLGILWFCDVDIHMKWQVDFVLLFISFLLPSTR